MKNFQSQNSFAHKVEEVQLYGNDFNGKRYVEFQLNDYQQFLYTRALHGLAVYSEKELCEMEPEKALRIIKTQKKTKNILNVWKQEIINNYCVNLFKELFPPHKQSNKISRDIINSANDIDPNYDPDISFRKLGISKIDMVNKLVEEKVLPQNFYFL